MKMKFKITRNISITFICIILGLMLAWQYRSIHYNQQVASIANKSERDLKDEFIAQKKTNDDLQAKINDLNNEIKGYKDTKGGYDSAIKNLDSELDKAKMIAGLTAVKGRGLIITIQDGDLFLISDTELLRLLNELRASGAQAISINGERMVATSEIREAGNYIMINGRQMVSPYEIKAIADPDQLDRSLSIIGGEIDKLNQMYKVAVKKSENIEIPKVRDDGTVIKTDLLTPVD